MGDNILNILDQCLARIKRGESVEQCLLEYSQYRAELEPLLKTAWAISALPRVSPSDEFCQASCKRLMARIKADQEQAGRGGRKTVGLSGLRRGLVFRMLVPATLVILAALIVWLVWPIFSPAPISTNEFILSLLSGNAEMKRTGSSIWLPGTDGMKLFTGSQVRAANGSYALLTFFDGSTTKLEPGAEVQVDQSEYINDRQVSIVLRQPSGKTWTHVLSNGKENPYFAIQTPQVKAVAQGTAFSTEVTADGYTTLIVSEGSISVMKGEKEIRLEANEQIQVGVKMALSTPSPVPPARDELVISTSLPGVGSVRDPSGASTGYLPDGLVFNQITDSKSVLSPGGQKITIEDPAPGEYLLAVRPISQESVPIYIQANRDGKIVSSYTDVLRVPSKNGWIIRIKLNKVSGAILNIDVTAIEEISGEVPEKVVETELTKQRSTPISTTGAQEDRTITVGPSVTPSVETSPVLKPTPTATATPGVQASPTQNAVSNAEPTVSSPTPTSGGIAGTSTPAITNAPSPTVSPASTTSPTPTISPTPTVSPTPKPAATSVDSSGGVMPGTSPNASPTPTPTVKPAPTATPAPTMEPTATPAPTPTPGPTAAPAPTTAPTKTPVPTKTPAPTQKTNGDAIADISGCQRRRPNRRPPIKVV